jgi:hypothetical protein
MVVLLLATSGCYDDNDTDRCTDGYDFDTDLKICIPHVDTDIGTDSGDSADSETDTELIGMGAECQKDDDCKQYHADTCIINPTNGEGSCGVADCKLKNGDCQAEYHCCDLTNVTIIDLGVDSLCSSQESADKLAGIGGNCD